MGRVHAELARLDGRSDPLREVAAHFAAQARVFCLDEFFVTDIGDAMILSALLKHLFARGVILVTTSNIEPGQLYRDGLQRAKFLPAIALIQQHCEIVELLSTQDYRLRALTRAGVTVKILTGDNELVTRKVCNDVAMTITKIVTGPQLAALDEAALDRQVEEDNGLARLTPQPK